jgi:hypothetical protein
LFKLEPPETERFVKILVVDIGGTNCKVWKNGTAEGEKFRSGKKLTPSRFVERVKQVAGDWAFDRVSIGYPGNVLTRAGPRVRGRVPAPAKRPR